MLEPRAVHPQSRRSEEKRNPRAGDAEDREGTEKEGRTVGKGKEKELVLSNRKKILCL